MDPVIKKFDIGSFIKRADNVLGKEITGIFNSRIKEVKNLGLNVENAYKIPSPKDQIAQIKRKIAKFQNDKSSAAEFTAAECFFLCLYVSDFSDSEECSEYIAYVLKNKNNWNDLFLRPLCCFVMSHWHDLELYRRFIPIYNLFCEKLKTYSGSSNRYCSWQKNIDYFKQKVDGLTGSAKFGKDMKQKSVPLIDAPSFFGFPTNFLHDEYYQDVILNYYAHKTEIPMDIENVLNEHSNKDTNKIAISVLIRDAADGVEPLASQKMSLQSLALKYVGHPSEPGLWNLVGYHDDDKKLVNDAAKILNQWLIEQYIEDVFKRFFNDDSRKKYWLKFARANCIESVMVVGQSEIGDELKSIPSIEKSVKYIYTKTRYREGMRCAFIMKIKGCNFIDFSDSGSIYVYRNDDWIEEFYRLNRSIGQKVSDLKNTNLPYDIHQNGNFRMRHPSSGSWMRNMNWFINRL